jgi:hypothetical protein
VGVGARGGDEHKKTGEGGRTSSPLLPRLSSPLLSLPYPLLPLLSPCPSSPLLLPLPHCCWWTLLLLPHLSSVVVVVVMVVAVVAGLWPWLLGCGHGCWVVVVVDAVVDVTWLRLCHMWLVDQVWSVT